MADKQPRKTDDPRVGNTPPNRNEPSKPAPMQTEDGKQMDDNIDDKGKKVGGGTLDQPT